VVREIWFTVTLVTHSSEMSSSESSRGIHHKCKHPLNPTKLYVSGWVESSRSVLNEESWHGWLLYGYRMMILCLTVWWKCIGSSLPGLLYGCLVCGTSSCDDHQFDWWEQMGEVLVVSKEMEILLLSLRGLDYICCCTFL